MFCPNCGANNPDDSAFCEKCGTPLTAQQQSTQAAPPTPPVPPAPPKPSVPSAPPAQPQQKTYQPQSQQPQMTQQPAPKKNKKRLITIIGIVVALLVIVCLVQAALGGYFTPKGLNGAVLQPQQIYEDDTLRVEVTGLYYDKDQSGAFGKPYKVELQLTNKTSGTISVKCDDWIYVNGGKCMPGYGTAEVSPGATIHDQSTLAFADVDSEYHTSNIRKVKTIEFSLNVSSANGEQVIGPFTLKTNLA